ncbi:MAG: alpha/beta hydrolase [Clostridia bacterium]|nr:alpha/beta hydrolase [Clostridia bacterium]
MLQAKNGTLPMDGTTLDYIAFGCGTEPLVMIPGLGDGLRTVRGMALGFSLQYGALAERFRVYCFSRKNELAEGSTTRDYADDLARAMDALGITGATVLGVSQGGMIAQHLTLRHPEKVKRLIICVTLARQNATVQSVVSRWISMAEAGDFRQMFIDTAEKSYSPAYLRRMRWMLPLAAWMSRPKEPQRFLIQARSCLTHDAYAELPRIACPTLVMGGGQDMIVGPAAAGEIAAQIPGSEVHIWPEYGHAAYEEAKDFQSRIVAFADAHP